MRERGDAMKLLAKVFAALCILCLIVGCALLLIGVVGWIQAYRANDPQVELDYLYNVGTPRVWLALLCILASRAFAAIGKGISS